MARRCLCSPARQIANVIVFQAEISCGSCHHAPADIEPERGQPTSQKVTIVPNFSKVEIDGLVAQGRINMVTVDTSIVDALGRNLDVQPLLSFGQFKRTGKQFVLSTVVAGEIKSHLAESAGETLTRLRAILRDIHKTWHHQVDAPTVEKSAGLSQTSTEFASTFFDKYVEATGATVIGLENRVDHDEVLRRYFAEEPPFSSGKKKSEFPDALALLSLEDWANRHNAFMLAVAKDGDWKKFCDASKRLIYVEDLGEALNYFNGDVSFVMARAVEMLQSGKAPELHDAIDTALADFFDSFDPDVEADCYIDFEIDVVEPTIEGWEVDKTVGQAALNSDEDGVIFSIGALVSARFTGGFRLQVLDSVDKDYVYLGTTSKTIEDTIPLKLVISVSRETDPEPTVFDVQVDARHIELNFGTLEPDLS
jgi:hypothetical protein